jgi:hypothetical protein
MTMINKEEYLASVAQEVNVLKHLAGKLTPETANYKPTEKQRTALELLRFLANSGSSTAHMLKGDAGADPETLMKRTENMTLEQFPAELDRDFVELSAVLNGMSDAELDESVDLWKVGMMMPRRLYFVNVILKQYAAYRMQLFLYLKQSGHPELSTANLWMGRDATPGERM